MLSYSSPCKRRWDFKPLGLQAFFLRVAQGDIQCSATAAGIRSDAGDTMQVRTSVRSVSQFPQSNIPSVKPQSPPATLVRNPSPSEMQNQS